MANIPLNGIRSNILKEYGIALFNTKFENKNCSDKTGSSQKIFHSGDNLTLNDRSFAAVQLVSSFECCANYSIKMSNTFTPITNSAAAP